MKIVLVGHPFVDLPLVGAADRVSVTSGERGRFRARLLPNLRYSVWGYVRDGGVLRETTIEPRVFAGGNVHLRERKPPVRAESIRLDGLDAWAGRGELRFELHARSPLNATLRLENGPVDGRLELPPWPAASLRIRDSSGRLLVDQKLPNAIDDDVLELDPPIRARVKVKYREGGKVLAGCHIVQPVDMRWVRIGTTDDKGEAIVEPVLAAGGRYVYLAALPETGSLTLGRQIAVTRDANGRVINPTKGDEARQKTGVWIEHEILCEKTGAPMDGRVLLEAGKPAAGHELLFFVSCPTGQGSWHHRKEVFPVRCDTEGRFRIRGVPERCEWRLFARVPAANELVVLAVGAGPVKKGLGDLVIAAMPSLDISIVEADDSPAAFAKIVVSGVKGRAGIGLYNDHAFDTNRRGKFRLRIGDRTHLRVAVGLDGSYVQADLKKHAGESELKLKLGARAKIVGRVVDAAGKPVPDATVYYSIRQLRGSRDLISRFSSEWRATTDADGFYTLRCPPNSLLRMHAYKTVGNKKLWARGGTPQVAVEEAATEVEDIVLNVGS